ncbi:MAG: AI-2E family transporter [Planctomycetales bacterium]|nr:AI-2E family transporter [Planctomycetales bacterium]
MPRVVSFIVLLGILLLIGSLFFQVMVQFVLPLFLASVLVVIFKPLHQWIGEKLPGRPRLMAMATTVVIVAIVVLPATVLGWRAYLETRDTVMRFLEDDAKKDALVKAVSDRETRVLEWYKTTFGSEPDIKGLVEQAAKQTSGWVVSGVKTVFGTLVGLAIMTFALYYFLADGPAMIDALMRLSPLDDDYERELLDKFSNVSRSVVVASLLSAVVQGILAGGGYFFALSGDAPIALLTMLTIVLALVPFVGAAAIWVPVVAWLYLVDGRTAAAVVLGVYCIGVVSMVDNFIKPYVLHGQANLHPLLALISVLGGVQVLGPVGILVGPMLVAFLQAILNMVHKELQLLGVPERARGSKRQQVSPSVRVEAEAAVGGEGFDWSLGGNDDGEQGDDGNGPQEQSKAPSSKPSASPSAQSSGGPDAGKPTGSEKRRRRRKR